MPNDSSTPTNTDVNAYFRQLEKAIEVLPPIEPGEYRLRVTGDLDQQMIVEKIEPDDRPRIEAVDLENSAQNAFVQNWLSAMMEGPGIEAEDVAAIEHVIELVQETYDHTDRQRRLAEQR
jgi:hypothetical protein